MLGELEQRIMNIVWENKQPLKPAEVLEKLNCNLAYTTIMTVMKRLVDKGMLRRSKKGNVYFYQVATPKQQYAETKLSELFSSIVNSYGTLAISQFVEAIKDNPDDLDKLKKYLESQND